MTDISADEPVLVHTDGSTLVITINRPAQRNAVDAEVSRRMADGIHPTRRITRSSGRRSCTGQASNFCAGMDIKAFARGERAYVPGRGFAGLVEAPPAKPLIAAVEGWALGGGFEIVLACDLVVAGRSARFGLPEVKRGLVARGGGALRLATRIPRALALEMLMTGEPIDAARAADLGLINRVVADGEALAVAHELAHAQSASARRWRSQQVSGSSSSRPSGRSRMPSPGRARSSIRSSPREDARRGCAAPSGTSGSRCGRAGDGGEIALRTRQRALDGVRIVWLSAPGPIPLAAMLLSDLGADVIRIDRPDAAPEVSGLGSADDPRTRGQRTIGIDLKNPRGCDVVRRLLTSADVFIEGMRPGAAERLGLGPDDLRAANPELIYARMTGWGQSGPICVGSGARHQLHRRRRARCIRSARHPNRRRYR